MTIQVSPDERYVAFSEFRSLGGDVPYRTYVASVAEGRFGLPAAGRAVGFSGSDEVCLVDGRSDHLVAWSLARPGEKRETAALPRGVVAANAGRALASLGHGRIGALSLVDGQVVWERAFDGSEGALMSPRGEALRALLYLFRRDDAVRTLRAG